MQPHFNILSFIISALIPMIMGFVYYHPNVMGKIWMKANGFTQESIGTGPKPIMFLVAFGAAALLTSFFWAWVTGVGGTDQLQVVDPVDGHSFVTFKHGVGHGILFTITVLMPIFVTMSIFEKRSWSWAFVNVGYWGLTAITMCGILSAWR